MPTPHAYIEAFEAKGVLLWREGDSLKYRAPDGVMTPKVIARLVTAKAVILPLLPEAPPEQRAPPELPGMTQNDPSLGHPPGGLLARVAQSWEMRLMLCLVPVLKQMSTRGSYGVSVLSWLHDGLTIHLRRSDERNRVVERLQRVFQYQADELGLSTCLVVE